MSRNTDLSTQTFNVKNANDVLTLEFENRIVLTGSETFVPPAAATAVRFTAVGGGGAGIGTTAGAGAGLFQKTFYAPWTGDYASFQLTVGAVEGDTILANNSGTSLARAFGATVISDSNPVGVGGTSCGGDLNTSGSPGGTSPGVGGASGGLIADSVYDDTYAGRWKYFQESITNENLKNYVVGNFYISGGTETAVAIGSATDYVVLTQEIGGTSSGGLPAGLFSNGGVSCSWPQSPAFTSADGIGIAGGYGGSGGNGSDGCGGFPLPPGRPGGGNCGGPGGKGGYGGNGGDGGIHAYYCGVTIYAQQGCPGGAGGYGGNGGNGAYGCGSGALIACSGNGGNGGFGGRGGNAGEVAPRYCGAAYIKAGQGGEGGFGGGGGRGGNASFIMCSPGPGVCCIGCQGVGGCGGAGGYGGGGGAQGCSYSNPAACAAAKGGAGGAGAIIVEWTTKEIIN